jgi:hypothetical protein
VLQLDGTRLSKCDLSRLEAFVQVIIRKVEKVEVVAIMIDPRTMQEPQGFERWIDGGQWNRNLFGHVGDVVVVQLHALSKLDVSQPVIFLQFDVDLSDSGSGGPSRPVWVAIDTARGMSSFVRYATTDRLTRCPR